MRTSAQVREELEYMLNYPGLLIENIEDILNDSKVLRNYGFLNYDDYQTIEDKVAEEKRERIYESYT